MTEEPTLLDKVNAGLSFGIPDPETHRAIMAELTELMEKPGPAQSGNQCSWRPEDLDRCEHGRHSIDPCVYCPHGWSTGNLFLARVAVLEDRNCKAEEQVRIGTMLDGRPIMVVPIRRGRTDG